MLRNIFILLMLCVLYVLLKDVVAPVLVSLTDNNIIDALHAIGRAFPG
jgi:hypothetical protein